MSKFSKYSKVFNYGQLFLSFSIIFGTWVIYIPTIKNKLGMSEGDLGIALLTSAIGALIGTPLGKILTNKFGEGKIAFSSTVTLCFMGIHIFLAPSYYWLCLALFMFGFTTAIMQVSINSLVVVVEKKQKISIMAMCHGYFSLGGLLSAGLGTFIVIWLNNPILHIIFSATIVFILQLGLKNNYFNIIRHQEVQQHKKNIGNVFGSLLLWALAIIGVTSMVAEGAIADWSGLFLIDVAHVNLEYVGLGYAGFSLSMTIGRFTGDYISNKIGAWQIIVGGYLISLVGFVVVLIAQSYLSILGFILVGVGFSSIVPQVFRQSANVTGIDSAGGIAFLSAASNIGFIGGPFVLGLIAERYNLTVSFIATTMLVLLGTLTSIVIFIGQRNKRTNETVTATLKSNSSKAIKAC